MPWPTYRFERLTRARRMLAGNALARVRSPGSRNLVSVVVPAVSAADRAALAATCGDLLGQTHERVDVIVVDGDPTNGTRRIVEPIGRRDARIRIVSRPNATHADAVECGLDEARGEFLCVVSSGGAVPPDLLARMIGGLREHPTREVLESSSDRSVVALRERAWILLGPAAVSSSRQFLDDFRDDFAAGPLGWVIEAPERGPAAELAAQMRAHVASVGHILVDAKRVDRLPRLWAPVACVRVVEDTAPGTRPPETHDLCVLVAAGTNRPTAAVDPAWDLCLWHEAASDPPRASGRRRGWLASADAKAVCAAVEVRLRAVHAARIEAERERPPASGCTVSVVVCTYRRAGALRTVLASLATQTIAAAEFEVVIVNNDPADSAVDAVVDQARRTRFADRPDRLRLVECPFPGLSAARNAGIGAARGAIVSFIDDDAVARPNWLAEIVATFASRPRAGVVGGTIALRSPEPPPPWLRPSWGKYWSEQHPRFMEPTAVDHWWDFPWGANWSARRVALVAIGGFRTGYGRRGNDAAGSEELVAAALIRRLGFDVIVAPQVEVVHEPPADRFHLGYVWQKLLAARREQYTQERDGYLPRSLSVRTIAREIARGLLRACSPRPRPAHVRLEAAMSAAAEASVLTLMLRDLRDRPRPDES